MWLHREFPKATLVPALSTAGAAEGLLDPATPWDAALCAPIAARRFGLAPMLTDVGDNTAAVTRFVLVSRPGPLPAPTGADKTTLAAYLGPDDKPGQLLELLEQFAVRGGEPVAAGVPADRRGHGPVLHVDRRRGARRRRPRGRGAQGPATGCAPR
jgi:prephenate dehydratase